MMIKKTVFLALTFLYAASCITAQNNSVDRFIKKEMKEISIPGIAVAIVSNGQILKMQSYGKSNIEWDASVNNNTLFPMASVTRIFTSSLISDMIDKGEINLNDSVTKYIKDCPYTWEDIRIKHLLSNTSGIKWLNNVDLHSSPEKAVNALKDSTLMHRPGNKENLTGGDYILLRHIIEAATGTNFTSLMQNRIFNRYGMSTAGYDMERRKGNEQTMKPMKNKSQIYLGKRNDINIYKFFYPEYLYCSAGLWMSIKDFASWVVALDRGLVCKDEYLLYDKGVFDNSDEQPSFSNLGWKAGVYQNKYYTGMSSGPAVAEIFRLPQEKFTVIVLTNQRSILPYLAKSIASFYIDGFNMPNIRKTLEF